MRQPSIGADQPAETHQTNGSDCADDLVYTQIQTDGGPQIMPTLVLRAAPFWLAGIDPKRVREEIRPEILRYQREVVDVLYAWRNLPK
jgi:hypothetical protein